MNLDTGKERTLATLPLDDLIAVGHLAFSPDGQWLAMSKATIDAQNQIGVEIFHVKSGAKAAIVLAPAGAGLINIAFSPDNRLVAVARFGEGTRVWDVSKVTSKAN